MDTHKVDLFIATPIATMSTTLEPLIDNLIVGSAKIRCAQFSRVHDVQVTGLAGAILVLVLSPYGVMMASIPQAMCAVPGGYIRTEETLAIMSLLMDACEKHPVSLQKATARIICAQFRNKYVLQDHLAVVVQTMQAHSLDPVIHPYHVLGKIGGSMPGTVDVVSGRGGPPRLYLEGKEML